MNIHGIKSSEFFPWMSWLVGDHCMVYLNKLTDAPKSYLPQDLNNTGNVTVKDIYYDSACNPRHKCGYDDCCEMNETSCSWDNTTDQFNCGK